MGTTLHDLFVAATLAGFEVLTTNHPGIYLVTDRQGRCIATLRDDTFRWFTTGT